MTTDTNEGECVAGLGKGEGGGGGKGQGRKGDRRGTSDFHMFHSCICIHWKNHVLGDSCATTLNRGVKTRHRVSKDILTIVHFFLVLDVVYVDLYYIQVFGFCLLFNDSNSSTKTEYDYLYGEIKKKQTKTNKQTKKGHIRKNLTNNGKPQRNSWELGKRRRRRTILRFVTDYLNTVHIFID